EPSGGELESTLALHQGGLLELDPQGPEAKRSGLQLAQGKIGEVEIIDLQRPRHRRILQWAVHLCGQLRTSAQWYVHQGAQLAQVQLRTRYVHTYPVVEPDVHGGM